jgi:hypothetical protein
MLLIYLLQVLMEQEAKLFWHHPEKHSGWMDQMPVLRAETTILSTLVPVTFQQRWK